jgi:two-component system, NarL family, nitrate/nitrite response regulator NarL
VHSIVNTFIFDNCTLIREGLKHILANSKYRVMLEGPLADDIQESLSSKSRDQLFLIGMDFDTASAANTVRRIRHRHPDARIALLGDKCVDRHVTFTIRSGADGFLVKTMHSNALIASLDLIMLGGKIVPNGFIRRVCDDPILLAKENKVAAMGSIAREDHVEPIAETISPEAMSKDSTCRPLSSREAYVLNFLLSGETNKSIARKCNLTEATIKVHIKAILRKIQVRNRTQAALWAVNHGLIDSRAGDPDAKGIVVSNGHELKGSEVVCGNEVPKPIYPSLTKRR